ncbi:hypothetical protein Vafri_2160 [Volvox africanus]|nr:hypothetical protein Vafri_2160 [Volvox africanus]
MASCFLCFKGQATDRREQENAAPVLAPKAAAVRTAESAAASQPTRLPLSTSKVQIPQPPAVAAPVPPVVLQLQRKLAALQGTWISRVGMALNYTMECTGATAVSLSMLSQTHDCLVVLARRGPQHLVLPPGSCISITEPGETAQSLENPEHHSLQHLYTSSAAVVRCMAPSRQLTNALPSNTSVAAASNVAHPANSPYGSESLPLDWAHLHATAGITHFAALPLYHGATLAGALTILGSNSSSSGDTTLPIPSAALASVNGGSPISPMSITPYLPAMGSNGGGAAAPVSSLDALFRAPFSLELVAMAVAQCCLGADMALARHAVEMVQAMHACASIQQLVGGISLGLQALMHARFCLTLRCNVALAVEFQPNAIMFEEAAGAQQPSGSGSQNNWNAYEANPSGPPSRAHHVTGRPSAAFSSPAPFPDGTRREAAHRMGSGGLVPVNGDAAAAVPGGGGGGGAATTATTTTTTGRAAYNTMRSGVDTTGEPLWCASSGHVTASALLTQIVGRRYKARPFSVYHTLLIRTIHELATSSYGGTVITQCHDHMQDAKTPSRDIYALGRGVGQPPQSLVLSVTHLRPADEALPDNTLHFGTGGNGSSSTRMFSAQSGRNGALSGRSNCHQSVATAAGSGGGDRSSEAVPPEASPENPSSSTGPTSISAHQVLSAAGTVDSPVPSEPRTYIGLYLSSTEPLPAALLELILVEIHSLACHVLSPLVHRKLLVGELAVEWSLMQTVTTSSLPQGADTSNPQGRTPRQNVQVAGAAMAATPGAVQAMGQVAAAAASRGNASIDMTSLTAAAAAVTAAGSVPASTGSTLCAGQLTAGSMTPVNPDGGDTTPAAAGAARVSVVTGGPVAPSGPSARLSSLQRIMAPFLMADMGIADGASGGGAAASRRSSDVAFAFSSAQGAAVGNGARSPSPGSTTNPAVGIRRILAFDAQAGKSAFPKHNRPSMSVSEGLARDMMLAAAAAASAPGAGGQPPGNDKFLSTEVATVQDTHSQMGLLVTSYKETLHNMHMELSVGGVCRQSLDLNADDPGRLVLREVLGKGGHGVVFRGTMHSLEVAIKVFQTPGEDEPLNAGTANRPEVLAETLLQRRRVLTRAALELALMSSISHPNIVQVYAQWPTALLERDETQPCRRRLRKLPPDTTPSPSGGLVCAVMVMEYCDKGTLVDAINRGDFVVPARDGSGFKANYKAIYTTLLEVALALRYLASMAVTHCDVKPANILLRSSPRDPRGFTTKLADFGYAALLRDSSPEGHRSVVTDEACGTVTHMAPESFVEGEPVDSSADVYAFGILMWELVSGKQPYHDRNLKQLPHEVVNKGLRPTFPSNTPDVYKSLAKSCWSPLPRNRPTAAQVVQSIQAQLDKIEAVARLLGKP